MAAEIIVFEVGAIIAKAILKAWLKPEDFAGDLSADIVDLLKGKSVDVFAARNGARQFEAIGDKISQSLMPIFQAETDLDDAGRTSVALAVAETIKESKITSSLLASFNLEPVELTKFMLANESKKTRDFSQPETSLYHRIIQEASRYIIDISSQLPSFTESTFSEILKREDYLVKTVNRILEEVQRIRDASERSEQGSARFEADYRSSVIRNLDKLELFGIDVSSASRRHRLSVAYVKLSVKYHLNLEEKKEDNPTCSIDQALSKSKMLCVIGDAGSGKTTLLQWVAVRAASLDFPEELSDWQNCIPFFIRLRQCVETGLPAPEDFPRFVAPVIANLAPNGWIHGQLNDGKAILLIDGIDEFPENKRQDFYNWLDDIINTFPKISVLITSRPYAISDEWLERMKFDRAELQPMKLNSMKEFVIHWHDAVKDELHNIEEQNELKDLADNLCLVLEKNLFIYELAITPLLCAMLCALHRERGRQLPYDRIELYEAGCEMLLERRDMERRIELKDYPKLSYRQKKAILQDLAYWMLINDYSEVELTRVEDRVGRRLENMEGISKDVGGKDVCRLFVHRSGLVREPAPGRFDFTHRSFQEFLAAKAALDEDDLGILLQKANNDQWREVIILAAGLASQKTSTELINSLINHGDQDTKQRHRYYLLAGACLETAIELPQGVRAEMQIRMGQIIPPKNMDDAQALASAGELVLMHLPKLRAEYQETESSAAACVRALVLIKRKESLEILASYLHETRPIVLEEIFNGWSSFDNDEYFEKIIKHIVSYGTLKLGHISTLNGFEKLTNISKLEIADCHAIADLSPLANMNDLNHLSLMGCSQVENLDFLIGMTDLVSLSLWDCDLVNNINQISHLNSLRFLTLRNCKKIHDLKPLGNLKLVELDIRDCPRATDLSPVLKLKTLKSLQHGESQISLEALKVFMCHASGDKPIVREIYQRLTSDGFDVWLDETRLLPGQDWTEEIENAVSQSDVIIICLSNQSINKQGYVQKEIKFALDVALEKPVDDIFIIPIRLDDCAVPQRLLRVQYADYFRPGGYDAMVRSLKHKAEQLGIRHNASKKQMT
jgi:hypothetical protein